MSSGTVKLERFETYPEPLSRFPLSPCRLNTLLPLPFFPISLENAAVVLEAQEHIQRWEVLKLTIRLVLARVEHRCLRIPPTRHDVDLKQFEEVDQFRHGSVARFTLLGLSKKR